VALHREGQLTPGGPFIEELCYMHGNQLGSMTLLNVLLTTRVKVN
jgi:hypothetical protein